MKRKCRIQAIAIILLLSLNLYPQWCKAQGEPDPVLDPDAPIDGGIGLLLAAGVGYGLKKANDKRKRNKVIDIFGKDEPM